MKTVKEIIEGAYKQHRADPDEIMGGQYRVTPRKAIQISAIGENEYTAKLFIVSLCVYLPSVDRYYRDIKFFTSMGMASMYKDKITEREQVIRLLKLMKDGRIL